MRIKLLALVLLLSLFEPAFSSQGNSFEPFVIGAARVDITPPPGFPTGGHGSAGSLARGYWHHLYARAFFLQPLKGRPLVLVSADLFAVPLGLRAKVWIEFQKQLKRLKPELRVDLKPQDLIIAATHTHQSPGNYSPEPAHGMFASSEPGFSQELFDFLTDQISAAILDAVVNRQPGGRVALHSANIGGLGREQLVMNRSPKVFMLNWDRNAVLDVLGKESGRPVPCAQLEGEPAEGWDLEDCPRLRAVDRRMTLLTMQDASGKTLGVLVFFAVHPTVLLHSAPLYSPDFVGIAIDDLETGNVGTIVGFFNGAEGDVAARRVRRDVLEVLDRAKQFTAAIQQVLGTRGTPLASDITTRARLFNTDKASDRTCRKQVMIGELAKMPVIGAAAPGGGELDRTHLYEPGYREGIKGRATGGQGPKLSATLFDPSHVPQLPPEVVDLLFGPKHLPITYTRIGTFVLGAIPVEMSTTQAFRIRNEFERSGGHFQILGMANQYSNYAATASEYAAQDYMGASTIWGPQEGDFLGCALLQLSKEEPPKEFSIPDESFRRIYTIASSIPILRTSFGTKHVGDTRDLPDEGLEEVMLDGWQRFERHLPYVEWSETIGNDVDNEFVAAGQRRIAIIDDGGATVDENDGNFIKMFRCALKKEHVWAAYWLKPLWEKHTGSLRFKITLQREGHEQKVTMSRPFTVNLNNNAKPTPITLEPPSATQSCDKQ